MKRIILIQDTCAMTDVIAKQRWEPPKQTKFVRWSFLDIVMLKLDKKEMRLDLVEDYLKQMEYRKKKHGVMMHHDTLF